jgi:hypothetical protein
MCECRIQQQHARPDEIGNFWTVGVAKVAAPVVTGLGKRQVVSVAPAGAMSAAADAAPVAENTRSFRDWGGALPTR